MRPDDEKVMVWLQRDALGPLNPALALHPGAARIFVFDIAWMVEEQPSPKRIRFIEECASEIGATLVRGSPLAIIREECHAAGIAKVVTTRTPCRHARKAMAVLSQSIPVDVLDLPGLVADPGPFDLGSFSRFWSGASKSAFGQA